MSAHAPLAARMRPRTLDEIVGQSKLTVAGGPLDLMTSGAFAGSILLYGPPGSGKTSIAQVIAEQTSQRFVELSATSAGVKEVRAAITAAEKALEDDDTSTVLFLDEIHRFSKAQQDVLLPVVESGLIQLIGATTENPSFSVNAALVSRAHLLVLEPLSEHDIVELLERALADDRASVAHFRPPMAHSRPSLGSPPEMSARRWVVSRSAPRSPRPRTRRPSTPRSSTR